MALIDDESSNLFRRRWYPRQPLSPVVGFDFCFWAFTIELRFAGVSTGLFRERSTDYF